VKSISDTAHCESPGNYSFICDHCLLITAGPGVTILDASKQHVHGKFRILSLESKILEI